MKRPRACGALLHDDRVLMVRHAEPMRSYWTLPGGAVEAGETPAEAAAREVWEETGLRTTAVRLLFETTYGNEGSSEYCFLMTPNGPLDARLGVDPEEAHLPQHQRQLQGIAWRPLTEMQGDAQVSAVLKALKESDGLSDHACL